MRTAIMILILVLQGIYMNAQQPDRVKNLYTNLGFGVLDHPGEANLYWDAGLGYKSIFARYRSAEVLGEDWEDVGLYFAPSIEGDKLSCTFNLGAVYTIREYSSNVFSPSIGITPRFMIERPAELFVAIDGSFNRGFVTYVGLGLRLELILDKSGEPRRFF